MKGKSGMGVVLLPDFTQTGKMALDHLDGWLQRHGTTQTVEVA